MPLPSKQEMIYSYLLEMFQGDIPQNGRLPSEHELAAMIGVARRTLRYTLQRLENEGVIIRTNHGTFLRKQHKRAEIPPVTVLIPSPDYHVSSGYWSSYLTQQMTIGAMDGAIKAGTYAVTLPVTINNDPSELDLRQLRHLDQDSMVIINGIEWTPGLIPLLIERRCRCGVITSREFSIDGFIANKIPISCCTFDKYWSCLANAVEQLAQDGAKKIVYFGRASADISKYGKPFFVEACRKLGLEYSEDQYALFDGSLSYHHELAQLRELYRKTGFDGLIFDNNFYFELPGDFDFYGETGIPRRTKMILGVSEILKYPDLPEHTRVLNRPIKKIATELTEFLLSGDKGQYSRHCEYEFPLLKEYFKQIQR